MLSNKITIAAKGNRRIKLSIYSGHFATGHAHVDRYISMTEIRSNAAMAAEAADEISKFFRCTPIDTIICLENTQVIGAFIAQDLIDSSHSVNSGATVNIITPGINSNNQLVFSSDMQQYVTNRNILLLMSTVSTGRSLARAAECIRYYGGKPVGIGSIFSRPAYSPIFNEYSNAARTISALRAAFFSALHRTGFVSVRLFPKGFIPSAFQVPLRRFPLRQECFFRSF